MDDRAAEALAALKKRDWVKLRLLLHPYLQWTDMDGRVVRGRSRVMAMLEQMDESDQPASIELRDGQIYRWRCRQRSRPVHAR